MLSGFNDINPVTFLYEHDSELLFNQGIFGTQQGLSLNLVNALSGCKDDTILNYSNIFLTDALPTNEIMYLDKPASGTLTFSTYLGLSAFPGVSQNTLFTAISSNPALSSVITFTKTLSDIQSTYFLFTDLNGLQCRISSIENNQTKNLTYNFYTSACYFSTQTPYITSKNSDVFEYSLDDNGYLKLFFRYDDKFFIIRNVANSLSAVNATTTQFLSTDIIGTVFRGEQNIDFKNDFIYYDKSKIKDFIVNESHTIPDVKQNYVLYYNYQSQYNFLTGSTAVVDFYKVKNVLSDDYYINDKLPFGYKDVVQRNYTSILSKQNSEIYNGNLQLNYNYYTKEFLFLPDVATKFTLPETLYPYSVINIDNSNLVNAGAYGGQSPVFSDKLTKSLNPNTNVVNYNEANGIYLYSWLFTNTTQLTSYWLDRYYYPKKTSLNVAYSGSNNQVSNYTSGLSAYLNTNYPANDYAYYDIRSSLTLEPSATYYYSRIGENYINKVVNTFQKAVTAFARYDNNNVLQSTTNNENFDSDGYGVFKLSSDSDNSFTISFNLNSGHIDDINSNLIVGNNFDEGVSLYKGGAKNIFTPGYFVNTLTGTDFYSTDNTYTFTVNVSSYVEAPVKVIDIINTGFDHIVKVLYLNLSNNTPGLLEFSIYNKIFNKYEFSSLANLFNDGNRLNVFDKLYYGDNQIWYLIKPTNGLNSIAKFDYLNNLLLSYDTAPVGNYNSIVTFNNTTQTLSGYCGDILDGYIGVSKLYNTVYFKNLSTGSEYPTLSTATGNVFDVVTYDDKMYVQTNGSIATYDKYKRTYTSYFTNSRAVSGIKLDFINENYKTKLLSYSADINGIILVDKFDIDTGVLESTFNTGVLVNPIFFNEFYYPTRAIYNGIVAKGVINSNFTTGSATNNSRQFVDALSTFPINAVLSFASDDSGADSKIVCRLNTTNGAVVPTDVVLSLSASYSNTILKSTSGIFTESSILSFDYKNIVPNAVYSLVCNRSNPISLPVTLSVGIENGSFFRGAFQNVVIGSSVVGNTLSGYSNELYAISNLSLTNQLGIVGLANVLTLSANSITPIASKSTTTINSITATQLTNFYNAAYNPHLLITVTPALTTFSPTVSQFISISATVIPSNLPLSGVAFQTPTNFTTIKSVNKFEQGDMVARLDLFSGNNYLNKQTQIVPFDVNNTSQIVMSFDPNNGFLEIYNNAELIKSVSLSANTFYTSYFLNNNFGVGMPFINNRAASTLGTNYNSFPNSYGITDFVVYNRALNSDEVKFNYIKTQKIDAVNFDIPQGTRNNTDTASSFNKLVIPGRKNNNVKIYIKNASLDDAGQAQLTSQLIDKLKNILPLNTGNVKIEYINYE